MELYIFNKRRFLFYDLGFLQCKKSLKIVVISATISSVK